MDMDIGGIVSIQAFTDIWNKVFNFYIDTLSMNFFFCSLNDVPTLFADFGRKISKAEFGHI